MIDRYRGALRRRLDQALVRQGERATDRLQPYRRHLLRLEAAPAAENRPRWGYGRPPHEGIRRVLAEGDATYRKVLDGLVGWSPDLARIPRDPGRPGEPCWVNPWLLGLDTVSLYGMVRDRRPRRYVEVGSGQSTMVVARARSDGDEHTVITSIDPAPRTEVDALCDEVVRSPLELADLDVFGALGAGDMVFVDGSHRAFQNSDVVTFHLDVLPELPDGVVVGVHDILWPDDYLPEWSEFWWSEQYLFGAYLLGRAPWLTPLLPCNYVAGHPELSLVLDPLWRSAAPLDVDRRGFCFWFEISR